MADEDLRALARAASDGDPQAETELLQQRLRVGQLTTPLVELAALLGHQPACRALDHTLANPLDLETFTGSHDAYYGEGERFCSILEAAVQAGNAAEERARLRIATWLESTWSQLTHFRREQGVAVAALPELNPELPLPQATLNATRELLWSTSHQPPAGQLLQLMEWRQSIERALASDLVPWILEEPQPDAECAT